MKELTWKQVWKFYEYALHFKTDGKYVIDWEEPGALTALGEPKTDKSGARIISK